MLRVLCSKNRLKLRLSILTLVAVAATSCVAQIGIWTSVAELKTIPASGPAWDSILMGASQDCANPNIANQDDNTNVYVLAAAIVYARTGDSRYKNKVVAACDKLAAKGNPGGLTLAWGREVGAYAMAADLAGYRAPAFETWLRHMAEVYKDDEGNTLQKTFKRRANNWGSHAFGSLCAIYRYLNDKAALAAIREYWSQGVTGPNPGYKFGDNISWHVDEENLRLFNPKDAMKKNMNVDGAMPDDLRRGGALQNPPGHTNYAWGFMQGQIMAARILERAGMPIWAVGDSALYRAAFCLQVRFEAQYGGWAARGDDEWMLPFLDKAYGTKWSQQQKHLWRHGKNAGWGYVTLSK